MFQTTQIRLRESAARKARNTEHFKGGMLTALNSAERLSKRKMESSLYLEVLRYLFI